MAAPKASPDVTGNHFRLLDLPAELRNRIYRFALSAPHPLSLRKYVVHQGRTCTSFGSVDENKRTTFALLALLCSCRTTRTEGRPIYYGCNTFAISQPSDLTDLLSLPAIRSTRRSLIKKVVLTVAQHMNITTARELRRLPGLKSVSIVYHLARDMFHCTPHQPQYTYHTHFVTKAQAQSVLSVGAHFVGNYNAKLREGFLSIIKTRPNVACILITSIDRHHNRSLPLSNRADHTYFDISLDETGLCKLSATLFKRSSLDSTSEQFSGLCY